MARVRQDTCCPLIKEQSLLDEYNRPIKKTIVFDVSKNKYYYKREVE